jgi:hypothetical protein
LNFYHSELATLARVFNYIYRFPAIVKKNVIAIACDACFTYKEVKNQALKLQQKFNFPFDLEKLTRQWSGEKLDLSQYPIIRDEQVPNKWLERRRAGKR